MSENPSIKPIKIEKHKKTKKLKTLAIAQFGRAEDCSF